jgi:hypothetical protein
MISRAFLRASAVGNVTLVDAAALDISSARSRGFMSDPPVRQRFAILGRVSPKLKGFVASFPL